MCDSSAAALVLRANVKYLFVLVFLRGAGYDTSGDNLPDHITKVTYLPQDVRDKLAAFSEEPQYIPSIDMNLSHHESTTWEERFAEFDRITLSVFKVYFDSTRVSRFAIVSCFLLFF